MIQQQQCKRCGYTWYPRTPKLPVKCARCGSPYWNKDKWKQSGPQRTTVKEVRQMSDQLELLKEQPEIPDSTGPRIENSQSELESQALDFLKRNKKKAIKGMSKAEINEWATLKANAARREAESLIAVGIWDREAWNRAIRSEILESETD